MLRFYLDRVPGFAVLVNSPGEFAGVLVESLTLTLLSRVQDNSWEHLLQDVRDATIPLEYKLSCIALKSF